MLCTLMCVPVCTHEYCMHRYVCAHTHCVCIHMCLCVHYAQRCVCTSVCAHMSYAHGVSVHTCVVQMHVCYMSVMCVHMCIRIACVCVSCALQSVGSATPSPHQSQLLPQPAPQGPTLPCQLLSEPRAGNSEDAGRFPGLGVNSLPGPRRKLSPEVCTSAVKHSSVPLQAELPEPRAKQ